jgi:hypothetical protein
LPYRERRALLEWLDLHGPAWRTPTHDPRRVGPLDGADVKLLDALALDTAGMYGDREPPTCMPRAA